MSTGAIITIEDEVRAIREELAARFDFDIRRIVEDAQRRQAASHSRIVSFQEPIATQPPPGAIAPLAAIPGR